MLSLIAKFWRDRLGSMAPMAAIFFIGLIPISGMAVDYTFASSAKRLLQEATDAAALAVGRANPPNQAEINRIARPAFDAHIKGAYGLKNTRITVRRAGDFAFEAVGQGDVPTFFSQMIGGPSMRAVVDARVEAQVEDIELVLVLDTTFSMTGSRISTLKSAARDLVDELMKGKKVRIGIVPFARYVNIGMQNRREPGFNIPDDGKACWMETTQETRQVNCRNEVRSGGTCSRDVNCRNVTTPGQGMCNRRTCTNESYSTTCPIMKDQFVSRTCKRDGRDYECGGMQKVQVGTERCTRTREVCTNTRVPCAPTTRRVCDKQSFPCPDRTERVCDRQTVDVQVERCRPTKWNGCVGSRPGQWAALDAHGGVDVPGAMDVACNSPLQTLTNNVGQLRSTIAGLDVDDETYIPSGLSMGWAVLSNRLPFTNGSPAQRGSTRAMVLMTDGINTISRNPNSPMHDRTDRAAADALTRDLCANIRADGVRLLTVAFEVTDSDVHSMLTDCATLPAYAFRAEDAEALRDAFRTIAALLVDLRLTR
jgi:Flp pilus assembly protein TadG